MENFSTCWCECSLDHYDQYLLWLALLATIFIPAPSNVGESVSEASHLGASSGGRGTWRWDRVTRSSSNLFVGERFHVRCDAKTTEINRMTRYFSGYKTRFEIMRV